MEDVMSKGRDRPAKEKRKPKADKNKKPKGGPAPMMASGSSTPMNIGAQQAKKP
jgi:hypothetical protein